MFTDLNTRQRDCRRCLLSFRATTQIMIFNRHTLWIHFASNTSIIHRCTWEILCICQGQLGHWKWGRWKFSCVWQHMSKSWKRTAAYPSYFTCLGLTCRLQLSWVCPSSFLCQPGQWCCSLEHRMAQCCHPWCQWVQQLGSCWFGRFADCLRAGDN